MTTTDFLQAIYSIFTILGISYLVGFGFMMGILAAFKIFNGIKIPITLNIFCRVDKYTERKSNDEN